MFSGDSQNQLMPFLFNIINGTNTEVSLNATQLLMANSNGELSPFNASAGTINTTDKKVAVIQVHHPIFKYDQECGPRGRNQ
jgi:protease-4